MISFDAGALRVVLRSMNTAQGTERKAASAAVLAAGRLLRDLVKQNISLRDHTLAELAALDHPYARRHGAIQIHQRGSKAIGNPANRVHTQSGRMLGALRSGSTANGLGYRVEIDTGAAPHAVFVIRGTKVMLPRDVLWDTATAPDVRRRMMREVVRVFGKGFRTQGSVRFGAGGTGGPGATGV
jgi:hypothetical protein